MRMRYEIEEDDEYTIAKELFTRRCVAWAVERDYPVDAGIIAVALDSRHTSSDGRLNFWTEAAVRRAVLERIPRAFDGDPPSSERVRGSVRTLIRYQAEHGLLDPRGQTFADLDAAVAAAVADYPAAAAAHPDESDVLSLLEQLVGRGVSDVDERMFTQLPIVLPAESALAAQAAECELAGRLQRLVEWVGPKGRKLTARGFLRIADARELVALLDTGDIVEGVRSSADLPRLGLLLAWAREARLVRVINGELRAVAKARPLLSDPIALWHRLFDSFFELGDAVLPAGGPYGWMCEDVTADVLNTLYSMPYPMPIIRLEIPVWMTWQERFSFFFDSPDDLEFYRAGCIAALHKILQALAELGAVELSVGVPHPDFSADLAEGFAEPFGPDFDATDRRALLSDLREASPLVRLTDLGTSAMRRRMLAQGREAGLVGDLIDAGPSELLGVIADHYTAEAAQLELQGWLARHNDDIEPLIAAVHQCPFRARAAAMLRMLVIGLPQRPDLLTELRTHPQLAPLVVMLLVEDGKLTHADLAPGEGDVAMTESFLMLLEVGGPDQIRAQLAQIPAADRAELAEVIRAAGHPASAAVVDLDAAMAGSTGRDRHLRSL
ncbi:hypothetical protein ACTWPB_27215 [Nocardia sp. IBHARD005]|uniref:hypothetical protein n=1 Tax=Nocardia sp. IBHARD005 TaxID=3457765 RepID=UPI0040581E31